MCSTVQLEAVELFFFFFFIFKRSAIQITSVPSCRRLYSRPRALADRGSARHGQHHTVQLRHWPGHGHEAISASSYQATPFAHGDISGQPQVFDRNTAAIRLSPRARSFAELILADEIHPRHAESQKRAAGSEWRKGR